MCHSTEHRKKLQTSLLLCRGLGSVTVPDLLQKKIALTMLVRRSSRVRAQTHDLPVARGIVRGPMRYCSTIRVPGPGKVRPKGLYQFRKLVVFRPERRALAR